MIDTEVAQAVLMGISEGWNDGQEVFVKVREGGIGSTSCSIMLILEDPNNETTSEYIVEAHLVEDDDDE